MTYEEAKMQIQAIPGKIWDQLSEPDREAMEMAFSALEKQIPKKPKRVGYFMLCPICYGRNRLFDYDYVVTKQRGHDGNISHCLVCGQAICWKGER